MKERIDDLTGKALDWAVAQLEHSGKEMGRHAHSDQLVIPELDEPLCYYDASSNWIIAGPIIEREKIDLFHQNNRSMGAIYMATDEDPHPSPFFGDTVIEAAMRCYVYKKTRNHYIDIPDDMVVS